MSIPTPYPGLVVCFSYLWSHEAKAGQVEGTKDRPCVIMSVKDDGLRGTLVNILPITHNKPEDERFAVEIPPEIKNRLGLDYEQSWIICNEANRTDWPGHDLRNIPRDDSKFDFGKLSPHIFTAAQSKFIIAARSRLLKVVPRMTDPMP